VKRVLLALALATTAAAQTADLRTTLTVATDPVRAGDVIPYTVTYENLGPDTITDVILEARMNSEICVGLTGVTMAAGERLTYTCSVAAPDDYVLGILATAWAQNDPNPANDQVLAVIRILTPPDLFVHSFPPQVVDAGLPFTLHVGYGNHAYTDAHDVTLVLSGHFATVGKLPANCTYNGSVVCALGDLPAPPLGQVAPARQLEFELVAPDASAAAVPIQIQIHAANEEDFRPGTNVAEVATRTYRTYFVTQPGDSGSGSLRSAIETANGDCRESGLCKIAFRIPPAATRWLTITPQSPLPRVTAPAIEVDADTQRRYFSDTNSDGPEIELSGARLTSGHGLELGCGGDVRGFAINGFPGSGIHTSRATCVTEGGIQSGMQIERNYVGTDPTGMTAVPNGRGITLEDGGWVVQANVISGNLRSGVAVENARAITRENVIGLNRTVTAGLGNGASGVYLAERAAGSDVFDNYIGFNAHAGVSLHPKMTYSAIFGNSFQANHSLAIDFGLDGATAEVPDDSARENPVRMPVIDSARYDAASDETIIEGDSRTYRDRHEVWMHVYANDERDPSGYGEGQYFLGKVLADREGGRFRFTMKGRPPGRWIAATTTRINIIGFARAPEPQFISGAGLTATTSEFGLAVEMQ